jgi:hypothetical protein
LKLGLVLDGVVERYFSDDHRKAKKIEASSMQLLAPASFPLVNRNFFLVQKSTKIEGKN